MFGTLLGSAVCFCAVIIELFCAMNGIMDARVLAMYFIFFIIGEAAIYSTFIVCDCVSKKWKEKRSYDFVGTAICLALHKFQKNQALKNALQIYPHLGNFLYIVLFRNKKVLGINPGVDACSLAPNGLRTIPRNNTVYYVYELITPNAPELDPSTFKSLVNQFITAELNNYGIANLPATFIAHQNVCPTVYLDRVVYDDVRHLLIFEVLFVSSNNAATALTKAWERDRPKNERPEPEVYADEL